MKNYRKLLQVLSIAFIFIICATLPLAAQDPPDPPPTHGYGGNVPGGGAPIGGGLLILTMLGAAYGVKKMYEKSKKTTIQ